MDLLFLSKRIYLGADNGDLVHGGIVVDSEGIIRKVLRTPHEVNTYLYNTESEAVYDFENMVLMPGLIDINVHINEPGSTDWEGFVTATKAAAAGGFTTIIDRPTNCLPVTTSVSALKAKTSTARGKLYIDVGFWGGFVSDNVEQLTPLLGAGAIGLQCTLCPSAAPVANDFKPVNAELLSRAVAQLDDDSVLAFHAELELPMAIAPNSEAPKQYESYLRTRPAEMELAAVKLITELAIKNKSKHIHIMNISSADVLPHIVACQRQGAQLTAETCPHYLVLSAEQIEDCHTEYKTQPPIRAAANQTQLWSELQTPNGCIGLISSDHSPATPGAKCLTYGSGRGNFLNAWPGISSLQLGLSAMWTHCTAHGLGLCDIQRLMCHNPAALCGLSTFKGRIAEGYDADFCIWDPDEEFSVTPDILFSSVKSTPYMNQRLRGAIHATVVRGLHVYQRYEAFGQPLGKVLLRKNCKKIVKFVRM